MDETTGNRNDAHTEIHKKNFSGPKTESSQRPQHKKLNESFASSKRMKQQANMSRTVSVSNDEPNGVSCKEDNVAMKDNNINWKHSGKTLGSVNDNSSDDGGNVVIEVASNDDNAEGAVQRVSNLSSLSRAVREGFKTITTVQIKKEKLTDAEEAENQDRQCDVEAGLIGEDVIMEYKAESSIERDH